MPQSVTIICAAWNESANLAQTLTLITNLKYDDPLEILVCAGGDDDTYAIASQFCPQITLLRQLPDDGKQKAVERCLAVATGEIIVFYDGDVLVNQASFQWLIEPILAGDEQVTTGVGRPLPEQIDQQFVRYQWVFQEHRQTANPAQYTHSVLGRNFALTRTVFEHAWPQTQARINEDFLIGLSIGEAGYRIRYVRESYVETDYPEAFWTYVRQTNRGLRANILVGQMLNKPQLVRDGFITGTIGLIGLLIPLASLILGPIGVVLWLIAWGLVAKRRTHYMRFRNELEGSNYPLVGWGLLKFMLASFVAWSWLWFQLLHPSWRTKWM